MISLLIAEGDIIRIVVDVERRKQRETMELDTRSKYLTAH